MFPLKKRRKSDSPPASTGCFSRVRFTIWFGRFSITGFGRLTTLGIVLSLFHDWVDDITRPSVWIMITLQLVTAAICSGAIGAPSGILAAKIFQTTESR